MKEPAPETVSGQFRRGDKLWWEGGGFGYKDRIPVIAWGPAGAKSFRVLVVHADDGSSMYRMALLSRLRRRFECESPDSASGLVLEYVRETYQVPAYVGRRVRYTGQGGPVEGTITGERAGMIRVRLDGRNRSFNFHPTWEIEYLPPAETVSDNP